MGDDAIKSRKETTVKEYDLHDAKALEEDEQVRYTHANVSAMTESARRSMTTDGSEDDAKWDKYKV